MSSDEKSPSKKRSHSSSSEDDEPSTKRKVSDSSPSAITEWDVEECRGDHESEEHWELRKQFLLQNMGRFPKSRLICLSQVFANHEFLGCRYPEETMELVQELSMGIVEEYREKQKNRLQRTFVKASDAAERKSKGANHSSNSNKFANTGDNRPMKFVPSTSSPSNPSYNSQHQQHLANFNGGHHPYPDLRNMIILVYAYNIGENAVCVVHRSCSAVNVPIDVEYTGTLGSYNCTFRIGNHLNIHSEGGHHSKDLAKSQAAELALRELQKHCYTFVTKVKVAPESDGKEIAKEDIDTKAEPNASTPAISSDNIGNKLLKMMGWTGGGLGKNQQGIHEAVSVDGVVGRSRLGLGNAAGVSFNKKIKELLETHQRIGFPYDLKFSSEFSKDERKEIHSIAQRLGLNKSKSFGKDEDRYIVVSEKVSRKNLIENTIAEGGETEKYCVIPPGGSWNKVEKFFNA